MPSPTRVVILGGGFAGVYTAVYLERLLRNTAQPVEVTIVSRENYLVFQPLLPDVISGAIEVLHVVNPIRRLAKHARLITRDVDEIDLANRRVRLAPGFRPEHLTLEYDHLVLALGTVLDYSKAPGMQEHAISFKYLGDALRIRNQVVRSLEEADIEDDPAERAKLLTFVVAGGGFSGVECIAELHDFVRRALKAYRRIQFKECRFMLIQSGERILPELAPNLAEFAQKILSRRGVEIVLETRLKAVSAGQAVIQSKNAAEPTIIAARTIIATVPAGPHALLASLPVKLDRGRVAADSFLRVPEWENIWALGDCAAVTQADGSISPPTAQHATRQAKTCAQNIAAQIQGKPLREFNFPGLGKLGSLGRGAAVAEVMGVKISGVLAWLLWRGVYLAKLPGIDRKIRVLSDWMFDLFLPRDITQARIFRPDSVESEHFEQGEIVFDQGNLGDKLYVIVRGQIDVLIDGEMVATLREGECFGEIALVANNPRAGTVRARTALDVVSVSRGAFDRLLAHLPGMRQTMDAIVEKHLSAAPETKPPGRSDH